MHIANEDSDESLMGRIQSGSHGAFAALVRRHTQRFYACAMRHGARPEEAEDIVQDAFLKLWERPEIWDGRRGVKFTTWFYRVVTNQTLDVLRRRRKVSGADVLEYIADGRAGAEDVLQMDEQQRAMEQAISDLPERQRTALNLCFYEGLSNKEAAQVMGVKIKALESLLMRAKTGLRDALMRNNIIAPQDRENEKERVRYA